MCDMFCNNPRISELIDGGSPAPQTPFYEPLDTPGVEVDVGGFGLNIEKVLELLHLKPK